MSGRTGMMIMPHPNPMIARPRRIKTGELYMPISLDVPTKNIPALVRRYPIKITAVF
jgi:hypothetical protein